MASEKVKNYRKTKFKYQCLSWFLCFGMALIYIIVAISGSAASPETEFSNEIKALLVKVLLLEGPMIVLSLICKDKMKPTVWMADIILANIFVGSWMMYITFAIWLVDTYFITRKIKEYETRIITRKEIDEG